MKQKPRKHCDYYIDDRSCETCPYPDCIASAKDIYEQMKKTGGKREDVNKGPCKAAERRTRDF